MIRKSNFFRSSNGYPAFEIEVYAFEVKDTIASMIKVYEDFDKALVEYEHQKAIFKDHIILKACRRYVRYTYGAYSTAYDETILEKC